MVYILYGNTHNPLTSRGRKFTAGDAFIGYQKDTPAAVVFQATQAFPAEWEHVSVPGLKADEEEAIEEDSHVWKEKVIELSSMLHCFTFSTGKGSSYQTAMWSVLYLGVAKEILNEY